MNTKKEQPMTEEFAYLEDRLEDQRKWHSGKSRLNKNRFYAVEVITLVAGGLIPVVNVLTNIPDPWQRVVSTLLAALIVIAAGIGKLYKFQENWLNYRLVEEVLRREREFHLYGLGEYEEQSVEQRNKILVERVETILADRTSQYMSFQKSDRDRAQRSSAVDQ